MKGSKLLAGLRNGRIIQKDYDKPDDSKNQSKHVVLIYSHHEGEVWGLCEMPNSDFFLTSGDDNKIIKWNMAKKQCVELCKIQA